MCAFNSTSTAIGMVSITDLPLPLRSGSVLAPPFLGSVRELVVVRSRWWRRTDPIAAGAPRRGAADRRQYSSCRSCCGETDLAFKSRAISATFSSMSEETPPARRMSEKELRARIDRIIADEQRTCEQLLELRDRVKRAAHPVDALPNISKIIATPSRFPWRMPRCPT